MIQEGCLPVVLVEPVSSSVRRLKQLIEGREDIQIVECANTLEALTILRRVESAVVLMSLGDREVVVKQISLLKMLVKPIRRGTIRVVCTSQQSHRPVVPLYQKHGISELVEEPFHPKSLQIKVDRFIHRLRRRMLASRKGQDGMDELAEEERTGRAPRKSGKSSKGSREAEPTFRIVDPLKIESDFWITQGGSARRVMGRWMIKLIGPSPATGRWVQMEGEYQDHEKFWEWVPAKPDDPTFLKEQGAWLFRGHKPEFVDDRWTFVSRAPQLAFYYENDNYGSKLDVDEGRNLVIAKDSDAARALIPAIYRTFEKIIRASMERQEGKDFKLEGEEAQAAFDQDVEAEEKSKRGWREGDLSADEEGAGAEDFVDAREQMAGVLNDLREEQEPAEDWGDLEDDADGPSAGELRDGRGPSLGKARGKKRGNKQGAPGDEEDGLEALQEGPDAIPGSARKGAGKTAEAAAGEEEEESDEPLEPGAKRKPKGAKNRHKTPSVDAAGRKEFRFPRAHFGDPGGDWDYVYQKVNGNRCFIFLVSELSEGMILDVSRMPDYWVYEGAEGPALAPDLRSWLFKDRSPARVEEFSMLPKPIRDYIKELQADPEDAAAGPGVVDLGDPRAAAAKKGGRVVGDLGGAGPAQPKKGAGGGEEDEGPDKVVEVLRDPEQRAAKEKGSQEDDGPGFAGTIKRKLRKLESELPPGVIEAVKQVELSLQKSGINALIESSGTTRAQERKKEAEQELKGSPGNPGLSAMAMAFLLSELLCKHDMQCAWITKRYCTYLHNAIGGLRVEVWAMQDGDWVQAASHGQDEREGEEAVKGLSLWMSEHGGVTVREMDPGQKVAAILGKDGEVIGALVVSGVDASKLADEYMAANAAMLTGLVIALGGQAAGSAAA